MNTILIIEDDEKIGNLEQEVLIQEGFSIKRAYSGTEAMLLLDTFTPDVIILDLMLPGMSGEAILEKAGKAPIIVVSAKGDVEDRVNILLKGASDFITKPFSPAELVARVKVQLRRPVARDDVFVYGNIQLNDKNHTVIMCETQVSLTRTEYAILKLLIQNPETVMTKKMILDSLFEDTPDCTDSSLKTHISHLRTKLKNVDGNDYIEAVWGIGFKMSDISTIS